MWNTSATPDRIEVVAIRAEPNDKINTPPTTKAESTSTCVCA